MEMRELYFIKWIELSSENFPTFNNIMKNKNIEL